MAKKVARKKTSKTGSVGARSEVRSPTSTRTEVRSPTSTSTKAHTQGNITVTGGAGAGATTVTIRGKGLGKGLQGLQGSGQRVRSWRTPKDCVVNRATVIKGGVEVSYRCGIGSNVDERGRSGMFPSPSGGSSTYPSVLLTGARSVSFRGAGISGDGARVGFVLSPASAVCSKSRSSSEVICKLVGDTSSASLQGARRRRKKRRR